MNLRCKGKEHEAYLSHVKVQITASRKNIYLVLVCEITKPPVMLATNKEVHSKELRAINALSFYITVCMAFLAMMSMKPETNALKVSIIETADPLKDKNFFHYYQLAKGISGMLSHAKEGSRLWFRTKSPAYRQLCLKLAV